VIFTPNGADDDATDGDDGTDSVDGDDGDDGNDCTPRGVYGAIWPSECKFHPARLNIENTSAENSKTKEILFKIIPSLSSPL
jgi:hypothetical protein